MGFHLIQFIQDSNWNLSDLKAGLYEVCLTNDLFPNFKQCYDLNIQEPIDLSVLVGINRDNREINLNLSGSSSYNILFNGLNLKHLVVN